MCLKIPTTRFPLVWNIEFYSLIKKKPTKSNVVYSWNMYNGLIAVRDRSMRLIDLLYLISQRLLWDFIIFTIWHQIIICNCYFPLSFQMPRFNQLFIRMDESVGRWHKYATSAHVKICCEYVKHEMKFHIHMRFMWWMKWILTDSKSTIIAPFRVNKASMHFVSDLAF